MAYGSLDLAFMFADFGEVVVFGAYTTKGILDFEGQGWGPEDQAQVGVEVITLTYEFVKLPSLVPGSALSVAGVNYAVTRGPRRMSDGQVAVAILEAV